MHIEGSGFIGRFVEGKIQEAIANGIFDDLPGKGTRLKLDHQPHVEPGMRISYHVLRNAGIAPGWLEKQKHLRIEIERARKRLVRSLTHSNHELQRDVYERFRTDCNQLNKAIVVVNLETPLPSLHIHLLNCELELRRIRVGLEKETRPVV